MTRATTSPSPRHACGPRRAAAWSERHRCRPRLELLEERTLLTFYGGYRTVTELYSSLAATAATYPNITNLVDYGDSYSKTVGGVTTPGGQHLNGYDLEALEISNKAIPGPKPVFVLNTGIHAREISGPEVAMKWIDYLTQNYGTNADVTWLVDYHDLWVVPVSNPDGHWYTELGNNSPWYWRKNGHPNSCSVWPGDNGGSYGVDLNRNFAFHWGGPGSSGNTCDDTYRGTSPASEPETAGLQNLVSSLIPDQKGPNDNDPAPPDTTGILIDVHTDAAMDLWPWGFTSAPPPNSAGLSAIGKKFATYNGYTAGQSYQTIYPATATTDDWTYGTLGAPAFTIEMDSNGFFPTYSSVTTLFNKNLNCFLYAAKIARTPYMESGGPDALSVSANVGGPGLRIGASINDTKNGNQNIMAAEFYVDTPPWEPGAVAHSMQASDGAFNSPTESVKGRLQTTGLGQGQHILFVRGEDSLGNWGPFSAAFFTVGPGVGGGSSRLALGSAPLPHSATLGAPALPPSPLLGRTLLQGAPSAAADVERKADGRPASPAASGRLVPAARADASDGLALDDVLPTW
jgi:hypothetical protein